MKNNKDSNRITEYVVCTELLWNVSFTYTEQFYFINYEQEGRKNRQTALWSSFNLYNIFYDHLDTENIPFPYTEVCVCECEGYIWIWSACQQCVPKFVSLALGSQKGNL